MRNLLNIRTFQKFIIFLGCLVLFSCSTNQKDFSDILAISKNDGPLQFDLKPKSQINSLPIKYGKKTFNLHLEICYSEKNKSPKGKVLFFIEEDFIYRGEKFCRSNIANTFLAHGFMVQRYWFEDNSKKTKFTLDNWGKHTNNITKKIVSAFDSPTSFPKIPLVGAYGYGAASIGAFQFAKQNQEISFLISGNGIYDLEHLLANNQSQLAERFKNSPEFKNSDFFEVRSIAWDYLQLPKKIALYHGQTNKQAPPEDASAFRDLLKAAEFKIRFDLIAKENHSIDSIVHQRILFSILKKYIAKP